MRAKVFLVDILLAICDGHSFEGHHLFLWSVRQSTQKPKYFFVNADNFLHLLWK